MKFKTRYILVFSFLIMVVSLARAEVYFYSTVEGVTAKLQWHHSRRKTQKGACRNGAKLGTVKSLQVVVFQF